MGRLFLMILLLANTAFAGKVLNCHTDAQQIGAEKFRSFDMSFPISNINSFLDGAKLYTNTYPPHHQEPNPFLKVKTEKVEMKDVLWSPDGEMALYFRAGNVNYVLKASKERDDLYTGILRASGNGRVELETRCYLFPLYP